MTEVRLSPRAALVSCLPVVLAACAEQPESVPDEPARVERRSEALVQAGCELLDDPETRAAMSGAFELKLLRDCGRLTSVPGTAEAFGARAFAPEAALPPDADVRINDPALDSGGSTQSETSVVAVGSTVCAAWNDAGEGFGTNGFSGFGVSTDGGQSWSDRGPFPNGPSDTNRGDPSLAYSERDGAFFYAALSTVGLSLWRSTDGCQSFVYVGPIHAGSGDDKELIAVDNYPASPYYGRLYVGWTNFSLGTDRNQASYSDDGGLTWSSAVSLPGSSTSGQGMWPAVAPNGDVFWALLRRAAAVGGLQDQLIYKSTNGGASFVQMPNIGSGQLRPENAANTSACGRQALNGDIRNLSSPQIAIHADTSAPAGYVLHAVYPYDSDGAGADQSNVFYRRSVDGAASWSAEVLLNDDATSTDQFVPALAVTSSGWVGVSWYDRRLDPANLLYDRYFVHSLDGGLTWDANVRVSDASSPVAETNPNFDGLATCYHGDYDQLAVGAGAFHLVWSDDRRVTGSGPNPDVYHDQVMVNPSVGQISVAPSTTACTGSLSLTVRDADLNGTGSVAVQLTTALGDAEPRSLAESGSEPGTFSGSIAVAPGAPVPGDGVLQVADADVATARYDDADDGSGNPAVVTDSALLDCAPPSLSNVRVASVGGSGATVLADASEAVTAQLHYGLACGALTSSVASGAASTTPSFLLNGLTRNTTYYYAITATDVVGNVATDDNAGACYALTTPDSIYLEDFEGGLGGFVIDNGFGDGNGLWHRSAACSAAAAGHTPAGALFYGLDASCNYNGGLSEGVATSPTIALADTSSASLELAYFLGTERLSSYDHATVELSVGAGAFVVIASNYGAGTALLDGTGTWHSATIDLVPYLPAASSANIRLRMHFETVDGAVNSYAGFYVDDLEIVGSGAPAPCASDAECDDGLFCTGVETCDEALGCQAGTPPSCADDGNPCTDHVCSPGVDACVAVANTASCNDGNTCTGGDVCAAGACAPGPVNLCAPQGRIFFDNFASGLGKWTETGEGDWNTEALHTSSGYPSGASGAPAAHSDTCTTECVLTLTQAIDLRPYASARLDFLRFVDVELDAGEYLRVELWNGTAWERRYDWTNGAGDDNVWHAESLDLAPYLNVSNFAVRFTTKSSLFSEHVHVDDVAVTVDGIRCAGSGDCNDGSSCNGVEACTAGRCAAGTPLACGDGDACTDDTCDPLSGCQHTTHVCSDGNVCTDDTCNSATGCVFPANTASCDDGDACTGGDLCSAGACVGPVDLCPDPVPIFSDSFGSGLAQWTETGEGDWNTEALHTSSGYPATASGAPAAHSDACTTECVITQATAINLTQYTQARLELLRFVDVELDAGEYLRLQVWNGTSWVQIFNWTQGAGDDNVWHGESVDLAPYLGVSAFRVRFLTKSSLTSEHVHVDDVRILAL